MKRINRITPLLAAALMTLGACSESHSDQTTAKSTTAPAEQLADNISHTKKSKKMTGAFLQISLKIEDENRPAAAGVYLKYKQPFLDQIDGATSKELLMRGDDVQVMHGFETEEQAKAYLTSSLFSNDVVGELGPLLAADPEIRIYSGMSPAENSMKATGAFLEITLKVDAAKRAAAAGVYSKYRKPFLTQIDGATSKELIMRGEDVQVLHGFKTEELAEAYLSTSLFSNDIVGELGPLLSADPEVRIYSVFKP